jgi:hypothetical protein
MLVAQPPLTASRAFFPAIDVRTPIIRLMIPLMSCAGTGDPSPVGVTVNGLICLSIWYYLL